MIVVRVELHSAVTCKVTLLGSMVIDNVGGTVDRGDYRARTFRKGVQPEDALVGGRKPQREGRVNGHPRLHKSVWNLVWKVLREMGFD